MTESIYALLKCYGERYIYSAPDQARLDLEENRDDMIDAFSAILDYVNRLTGED